MSDDEDVQNRSTGRVCDETRLDPSIDAPAMSPVEHAVELGAFYLKEDERTRRSLGKPPIKYRARLPGAPPACESYQQEALLAAGLGGQVVARLLTGVTAAPAAPAPKASHGIEFSGNPIAWIKRLFRRGR